jgi:cytochrome c2
MRVLATVAIFLYTSANLYAALPIPGDARLGAQIFKDQKCITCHSVSGEGGKTAPDLGRRAGRSYTPNSMAALMWNHAPTMWSAIEKAGIDRPKLTDEDAANLFAYFYAARYFDRPGDAGRGKAVFHQRGCAECHTGAKAITSSEVVGDPIAFSRAMWNHASLMKTELDKKRLPWPRLTPQQLTDIVVYLQTQPGMKKAQPEFAPASAETGQMLFQVKGCAECHRSSNALENRFSNRTMNDFAAAMWNHAAEMHQVPPDLRTEEMRRIVGYLWSIQFFEPKGNGARGQKVFENKRCATCHVGGGAPDLAARPEMNSFGMVSALWDHGPAMLDQMRGKNIRWPRFNTNEMADLIAYLQGMKK